jgi:sugar transferase (PEP-CTERM/EpsH1 system associated)
MGRSATEGLFWSRRLYRTVSRWARETHFDAVLVYCSSMLQYLATPALRSVPAIVDLVDVDSQKWFDYAQIARGLKRHVFRLEGKRLRRLEQDACCRASSVMLVSEAEANLFRHVCPNNRTHSMPNGVDCDYFRTTDREGRAGRCIFVGALDYRANIDGICWFCREVWPHVRAQIPIATLAIVGRNPTADVRQLGSIPGVEVFASVPDVRPYLADATLVVAPLRIARGVQNKVLEAMAGGRAVVASPEALEGINVRVGEHVIDAASPRRWSDEIVRLLNDATARQRLAQAGRRFVVDHHAWEACLAPLNRQLEQAHKPAVGPKSLRLETRLNSREQIVASV